MMDQPKNLTHCSQTRIQAKPRVLLLPTVTLREARGPSPTSSHVTLPIPSTPLGPWGLFCCICSTSRQHSHIDAPPPLLSLSLSLCLCLCLGLSVALPVSLSIHFHIQNCQDLSDCRHDDPSAPPPPPVPTTVSSLILYYVILYRCMSQRTAWCCWPLHVAPCSCLLPAQSRPAQQQQS